MLIKKIDPSKDIVFDLKVSEACKACKRYGLTGCCPPNIGEFAYYKKLLKRYKFGLLYVEKYLVEDKAKYKEVGRSSSLDLHKILLKKRQELLNKGHYFNIILGGGSCKWCKECAIPCKMPQFRAIPIEATGVNVVETLHRLGLFLKFPVKNYFYRIGMVLYD